MLIYKLVSCITTPPPQKKNHKEIQKTYTTEKALLSAKLFFLTK